MGWFLLCSFRSEAVRGTVELLKLTRIDSASAAPLCTNRSQVVAADLGAGNVPPKLSVLDAHGCSPQCACTSGAQEFVVGAAQICHPVFNPFTPQPLACDLLGSIIIDLLSSSDSLSLWRRSFPFCCVAPFRYSPGRSEGVYFYGTDGRGQCLAFPGEKRQLASFEGYLMVLAGGPPGTVATSQISLYDLRNKLIAFQAPQGDVAHVMCVPGCVTVLLTDGTAFALVERDLTAKLDLLFRKSLYGIAISLIQAEGGSDAAVAEVRRRLADHLYGKQDFDGAMAQYIQTIGRAPPHVGRECHASRSETLRI